MNQGGKFKLRKLLDDSLLSYYWLGFLFADGHFTKNGRLVVTLSIKDKNHLISFSEFLNSDISVRYAKDGRSCTVAVMDVNTLNAIRSRYDVSNNKSVTPPNISTLSGDKLTSFAIGFIDGDGRIFKQHNRDDCGITIKVHSSWIDVLNYMFQKESAYLQNSGYGCINITKISEVVYYKTFALDHNLPVLKRKWDKIDVERESRNNGMDDRERKIRQFVLSGSSYVDIAEKLGLKYTTLYQFIKRRNIG